MAKHDIVYGRNPVLELFRSDQQIDKIWIDRKMTGEFEKKIRATARDATIPLVKVPIQKINSVIQGNHQGIIAFTTPVQYLTLPELMVRTEADKGKRVFLLLDRISDIRNIGAMARSAYWFGVDGIIYSIKNAAPLNADAIKTSAGSLLHIPVSRVQSIMQAIEFLQSESFKVVGSVMEHGNQVDECDLDYDVLLVMGSEERGISREIGRILDEKVTIPGKGNIDSLNVSVATGVLLYEIYKQKSKKT